MSHLLAHLVEIDGDGPQPTETIKTEIDKKIVVIWRPTTAPITGDMFSLSVNGTCVDFINTGGTVIGNKVVWTSGKVKAVPGTATLDLKRIGGTPSCTVELKLEPVKKDVSNTTIAIVSVVLVAILCLGCSLAGIGGVYKMWFATPDPAIVTTPPVVPEETKPDPKPEPEKVKAEETNHIPVPVDVQLSCTPDLRVCGEKTKTQDGFVCCRHPDLDDYGPSLYRVKNMVKKDGVWRYGELELVHRGVIIHTMDKPAP